jgi:phage baseplate assembly protein W
MFKGYSVSLPLVYNKEDGPFALNKNMIDVVKQNLKTLILTDKGERIMLPNFGVGLRKFLFENMSDTINVQIEQEIIEQVRRYMPFVNIRRVLVLEDPDILNKLYISVEFIVPALNVADVLQIG